MTLRLDPVHLATNSDDREGQLVFRGEMLVAVLVRLSALHGDDAGKWFLEIAFNQPAFGRAPTFADLEEAKTWIAMHTDGRFTGN